MKRQQMVLPWVLLVIPVLWLAALLASGYKDGMTLFDLMAVFPTLMEKPFAIRWTPHTLKFLLIGLAAYGCAATLYFSASENRRPGEEHGSARWGNVRQLNRKYRDKDPENNVILTQHLQMGLDGRKHRRNLLQIVIGGSGAGKTRFYALPNLMQSNCSFVASDPKGELLANTGPLLIEKGYTLRVLNLIHPEQSDFYNPFYYIREDKDVLRLVNMLIKNTTPKQSKTDDPFWEKAETALLMALMFYLIYEAPPEEQNFATVMYLIENADVQEEEEESPSALDLLFLELEDRDAEHIAVKFYRVFQQAAGKTAKSILVSAAVRLAPFNLPEIAHITSRDSMEIGQTGDRLTAVFCVIPDSDTSLNFLVSLFYSQLFSELYLTADSAKGRRLKIPVRLIMDEFPNIPVPGGDDFERILATMRSREISASIIIQNMAQLKALFRDNWESIVGLCDSLLYLGGNEQSTHKYLSELLGKETIETKSRGLTRGLHGNSSENTQSAGRELLTPDEVRLLDNRCALLFVRGELPVLDEKYPLEQHPNYCLTEAGGQPPYIHRPTGIDQQPPAKLAESEETEEIHDEDEMEETH